MLEDYANFALFVGGAVAFVTISLTVARLIRANRPNQEKLTTYECGEDPVGSPWGQFNLRFYVMALMFVLFEAEMVFLFPWAVVFTDAELMESTNKAWGWFTLAEMFLFLSILFLGLVYAWRKGFLNWEKPKVHTHDYASPVPQALYEEINQRYLNKEKLAEA